MSYLKFVCKKCGHAVFVENNDTAFERIQTISYLECPECSAHFHKNWLLVGTVQELPVKVDDDL